jgi:metallo-beta-lactamase family protein
VILGVASYRSPMPELRVTRPEVPILTFLGGAGTVTGSRYLIDTPDARVLVDAGLFQGLKQLRLRNWEPFPVPPDSLDAIVLTHAHVDHLGYLPALVRDGFRGRVFATPGTIALAGIVLPDCGHLQEEEAEYANRKGFSKHSPALPLYTEADAFGSLRHLEPVPYGSEREIAPGIMLVFRPAGHILGSATASIRLADGYNRTLLFSGDLGRPHHPILGPPAPVGDADVIVCESTYGDRIHDDDGALDRFTRLIAKTIAAGGTVLIPAFAVDRTEVVLFHLRQLIDAGAIPDVPVFVDSPMASAALNLYRRAIANGDEEIRPELRRAGDPFDHGRLIEIRDVEQSKGLAGLTFPAIIISASGMATGGRVVHHLSRLLPNSRNTVILVGFQAAGTRGRLLVDGARQIKMLGRYVPVRATIGDVGSFSIHADQDELVGWLGTATKQPDAVYLVHGEPDASEELRDAVARRCGLEAIVARHFERVRLD